MKKEGSNFFRRFLFRFNLCFHAIGSANMHSMVEVGFRTRIYDVNVIFALLPHGVFTTKPWIWGYMI